MSIEDLRVDEEGIVYKGSDKARHWNCKGYRQMQYGNKRYKIHQVVAHHHHGARPSPNHQVNHIDGVKDNNHPSNLEWVTASENQQHARDVGLHTYKTSRPVVSDNGKGFGHYYPSGLDAAKHTNTFNTNINKVLAGKRQTAANLQWRYSDVRKAC